MDRLGGKKVLYGMSKAALAKIVLDKILSFNI